MQAHLLLDDVCVDLLAGKAWRAGRPLGLNWMELKLLCFLAQRGTALSSEIHEHVIGRPWQTETNVVAVHIARLRERLGEPLRAPRLILTVEGGYALAVKPRLQVERLDLS